MKAIDLFAGLGGFTEGAKAAGVEVLWAANHWRDAVNMHALNHPNTVHACQDLHQADWEQVPRMDLLLASPSCQGHAKARGKERPHHDKARSTAWAVVSCAEYHRPAAVVVENVPEFLQWSLFPAWKLGMEALGYALSVNILDAADAGVPQNRLRSFVVGTRSKSPLVIQKPQMPHKHATDIIDWNLGVWRPVHKPGRAVATLNRYERGLASFGSRFLMSYYGSGSGLTGRSVHRPIGAITTRERWAVVKDGWMRMVNPIECRRAMGFSESYIIPHMTKPAIFMLGNAVPPPLAAYVITQVKQSA